MVIRPSFCVNNWQVHWCHLISVERLSSTVSETSNDISYRQPLRPVTTIIRNHTTYRRNKYDEMHGKNGEVISYSSSKFWPIRWLCRETNISFSLLPSPSPTSLKKSTIAAWDNLWDHGIVCSGRILFTCRSWRPISKESLSLRWPAMEALGDKRPYPFLCRACQAYEHVSLSANPISDWTRKSESIWIVTVCLHTCMMINENNAAFSTWRWMPYVHMPTRTCHE